VGIAALVLFKYIIESALHNFVLSPNEDGSIDLIKNSPWLFVLYAVIVTGVFHESARFISFFLMKKKYSGLGTGLSYGIGYAGVETVLIVGVMMMGMILISLQINSGDLSVYGDTPEAIAHIEAIASDFPGNYLIPAIERVIAMAISLSLSIVVLCAVTFKDKLWMYPAAIGAHALAAAPMVMIRANILDDIWIAQSLAIIPTALIAYGAHKVCKILPETEIAIKPKTAKEQEYQGPTL